MQGPRGCREIGSQEEAGPRHVVLDGARMPHPRIDGIEQAPAARGRSIGGALVAIVVPPGLLAAPPAKAARADHRPTRDLVPRPGPAAGRATRPAPTETEQR